MEPLIVSYYTLTGAPVGAPPRHSLAARAAAARAAGFTGMALAPDELLREDAEFESAVEIGALLAEHGLDAPELEPLRGWDGEPDEAAAVAERALFELAEALGSERVNTIQMVDPAAVGERLVAERLAAVCDRAAEHGLTVSFEPRANSPVATPAAALELLDAAGRENSGITLDAYHFHRAGLGPQDLAAIPAERITGLQLNDMLAEPAGDPVADALEHRMVPGEGTIELGAWLAALRAHGVAAPPAVEAISRVQMERPLEEAARRAAEGARAALARAADGTGAVAG